MSAVCGNAVKAVYDELMPAEADPDGSAWPHAISWQHSHSTATLTVPGNWSGYYDKDNYVMTAAPAGADSTTVSFSFINASPDTKMATLTCTDSKTGAKTDYTVTMTLNPVS